MKNFIFSAVKREFLHTLYQMLRLVGDIENVRMNREIVPALSVLFTLIKERFLTFSIPSKRFIKFYII